MRRLARSLSLLLLALPFAAQAWEPERVEVSLPPDSLAQWYPPASDRPVFFFHMMQLGRSMQAASDYAALEDRERLAKWAGRLTKAYTEVGEMVPEWRDELELQWAERLQKAAREGDWSTAGTALRRLGTSCRSCHNEYRPAAKLIYHIPAYDQAMVESSETLEELPYDEVMAALGRHMNRMAIATEDGRSDEADSAFEAFSGLMEDLRGSCGACHGEAPPVERVYTPAYEQHLTALQRALGDSDAEAAGNALSGIGGTACSSCHGIHRPAAIARHLVYEAPGE